MISIVITSFNEPKTIGKAIGSFLNQKIKEKYELLVVCPDELTIKVIKKYVKKSSLVKHILDEGKGKSVALNKVLKIAKGRILILTDGDVFVSRNSVNELLKTFEDKKVGCVTGKPTSVNSKSNLFGYWSHLLCYAAHRLRLKRNKKREFLECSGYLWAFRNKVITSIPRETAEDTIVPILFYLKGYKTKYTPKAEVYIKYPSNLHEFIDQKKRTAKGHETLSRYVDIKKIPRMKSLKNEILESYTIFSYPENLKEFFWTLLLFPLRLYIWLLAFFHLYIKKNAQVDGWDPVKTTKS